MKKLFALLLALVLVLSLAACGGGNGDKPPDGGNDSPGTSQQEQDESAEDDPAPEGIDAEYEIFVNGVEEWRPFPGKSGVTFSVSDTYVIACRETSSTISFTGKQVGSSTITATLDGVEKIATVKVKRMVEKEEEEEGAVVPLILDLPGSFYVEYLRADSENITSECLTATSYAYKYFDEDEAYYGWNIDYYTLESSYDYLEGYGWIDTTEDHGWTSGKFNSWSAEGENPIYYETLTLFRSVVLERGNSAPDNISKFYTGETETIAGIECKIYEMYSMKYWIEPTYHFCLKYSGDGEYDYTVTKFEAPYTNENPLAPAPGAVIHTP